MSSPQNNINQDVSFYQYLTNKSFSFYVCEQIQGLSKEKRGLAVISDKSPQNPLKCILVISEGRIFFPTLTNRMIDVVLSVPFNPSVLQKLNLAHQGTFPNKVSFGYNKSEEQGSKQLGRENRFISSPGVRDEQREISILCAFPMRLLLKVTSKKLDQKSVSLYFKVPKVSEDWTNRFNNVFNWSDDNIERFFAAMRGIEIIKLLDEVTGNADDKVKNIISPNVNHCIEIHREQRRISSCR